MASGFWPRDLLSSASASGSFSESWVELTRSASELRSCSSWGVTRGNLRRPATLRLSRASRLRRRRAQECCGADSKYAMNRGEVPCVWRKAPPPIAPALPHQRELADRLIAHGQLLHQIVAHFIATSRSVGNRDLEIRRHRHLRLNDVLAPVARRGRHIAGQREVLKRRKRYVVRAPDAGLEHAAAPYRNSPLLRGVVHMDSFGESPHAAQLDVDDPARLHLDRRQRVAPVADRFVKADRRPHLLLQHRV